MVSRQNRPDAATKCGHACKQARFGAEREPKYWDWDGIRLTFGLFLVALLLSLPACQATRLGAVAEIALPLLGVRLEDAIPAVFGRVLAGVHGAFVAVWALVIVAVACRPPYQVTRWLL
jgi:hypothetical protein